MVILITSIWISYSSFSNKISEVLTVWIIQIKMDTLTHPQPSKNPHALVSIFLDPIFLEIFLLHKGLYPNCPEYDQSVVSLFVVGDNTSNTWKFVEVIGGIIPTSQRDYLWQHWVSYTWIIPIAVRGSSTGVTEWARVACRNSTTRSGRTWTGPWSSGGSTPGTRNVGTGRALGRGSIVFVLFFQNILFVWWMFIAVVFSTVLAKMEKCTMK